MESRETQSAKYPAGILFGTIRTRCPISLGLPSKIRQLERGSGDENAEPERLTAYMRQNSLGN